MSHLYYRLSNTDDPEERLEDAALYKALFDEFGKGLTLVAHDRPAPEEGLFLGRGKRLEFSSKNKLTSDVVKYWHDSGFLGNISRSFMVTNLAGAEREVDRLHAAGMGAFVKSTKQKEMVLKVPRGQALGDALGDMVWSYIEKPDCLMVQEHVDMSYERRFLVMNGKVVTHSPVAWHLTPMSRYEIHDETGFDVEDLHYRSATSREARFSPTGARRMKDFAQKVADESSLRHICVDLAVLGDDIEKDPLEVIEFNPMQPGGVGLYACSPKAIAKAVREALQPELRVLVEARQAGTLDAQILLDHGVPTRSHAEDTIENDDPFEDEDFIDEAPIRFEL